MKRKITVIALICCLILLTGCNQSPEGGQGDADDINDPDRVPQDNNEIEYDAIREEDVAGTYWTATEYIEAHLEGEPDEAVAMPKDGWSVDLILYEEGGARFRSIENDVYTEGTEKLADSSWYVDSDSGKLIVSIFDAEEELTGQMLDGRLYVDAFGGMLIMEKGEIPVNGAEWAAADLVGTWTLITLEGEDYAASAEELGIEGEVTFEPGYPGLLASYYSSDEYGNGDAVFAVPAFYEEGMLYEGCPNESWIVAFTSDDGMTEFYGTMVSRDELHMLVFRYMKGEEYPYVTTQTFLWQSNGEIAVG